MPADHDLFSSFTRVAVTVPPPSWFHGIDKVLFDLYREALVDMGLRLFDVPVDAFLQPDVVRIGPLLENLVSFAPQLAIGLPHGLHALLCRMPAGGDGWRANVFTDVLDVPTICQWDHAPLELAVQLLPHAADPGSSSGGADYALRRALTHPRMLHWSRDSGQTILMHELGLASPEQVVLENSPALPRFEGTMEATAQGIGFIGHLYSETSVYPHPELTSLAEAAISNWWRMPQSRLWDVMQEKIGGQSGDFRRDLALDPDQTYFWHFAHRLIREHAQTSMRLRTLAALRSPVMCYGNFANLAALPSNVVCAGDGIPFGPELAAVMSRHAVTVDALNPGFIEGYSHKVVLGFASGGFVLLNRKRDFLHNFGEAGEAVSYSDLEELGRKVEYFLAHPKQRREVGVEIRDRIRTRFRLREVLSRVLTQAAALAGPVPAPTKTWRSESRGVLVRDLLPSLLTASQEAKVELGSHGVLVETPPEAWTWGAVLPMTGLTQSLREPHLRFKLLVNAGRIGIGAFHRGAMLAEQHASRSEAAVTLTVELPHGGVDTVVIRTTVDEVSRALILEAWLCDRD